MKRHGKWLSGLLAIWMLLTLLPVSALADNTQDAPLHAEEAALLDPPTAPAAAEMNASETADGLRDGDFIYSLTDGIATITEYVGSDEDVTVPGEIGGYPVTAVASYTFYNNHTVRSITFGEGIRSLLGNWAYNCIALETICFSSTIGMDDGGTSGLSSMPGWCPNVKTLIVAEGSENLTVYNGALYDKAMTKLLYYPPAYPATVLDIPDGVVSIGSSACYEALNLTEIKMPDTVKYIGYWSFDHCRNLEKINISENCEFIGQYAFQYTALKTIHIPASLTMIASGAFGSGCDLETITVDPDNPCHYTTDNVLYCTLDTGSMLVKYPSGSAQTQFAIPEGVTWIQWYAFDSADNLTYVDVPSGVTYIGNHAFNNCVNLEAITLRDGLTEIETGAFFSCTSLKELEIPVSVTSIGDHLLANCSPNRVIFYGDAPAFDAKTFSGCVTTAYYPKDNATWTADVLKQYGGTVTWKGHTPHSEHSYEPVVTAPTCTEKGFTTHTCSNCGVFYIDSETPALGHDWHTTEWYCFRCNIAAERPFVDVPPNVHYYNPVIWAVENGITNGTSSTTFSPNNPCTRWQIVTFLWRAAGCPEPTSLEHNFKDIAPDSFYLKAVLWAVENGITNGTTATTFSPNDICTRWQIVTFLWRYAGCPEPTNTEHNFTDVSAERVYYKAMLWAVDNGITNGTTPTTFAPNAPCTRAQIVTFLYRYIVV